MLEKVKNEFKSNISLIAEGNEFDVRKYSSFTKRKQSYGIDA
jgi:hypothetical protein